MTTYVDGDPVAAVDLVLARLEDNQRQVDEVFTGASMAALCGGLLEVLVCFGTVTCGGPEQFAQALREYVVMYQLGDLKLDGPDPE